MHMLHSSEMKKGFTMAEILVVLTIMGILSAMGISAMRDAIVNNRVKDASLNVAAYLERVANETNRISDKVCVKNDGKELYAAKGDCNAASKNNKISSYTLEGPLDFDLTTRGKDCSDNWLASDDGEFKPRFGLSAAPVEGCIVIKYGASNKFARVLKLRTKNNIIPQVSYDSAKTWTGL